jgi:hypothetical protein
VTAVERHGRQEAQRRGAVRTALVLAVLAVACYVTFIAIRL